MWSVALGVRAKFKGTNITGTVNRQIIELDGQQQWGFRYIDGDGVIQDKWVVAAELEPAE